MERTISQIFLALSVPALVFHLLIPGASDTPVWGTLIISNIWYAAHKIKEDRA